MKPAKKEKVHPVVKAARRESREYGYELRATVVKDTEEASRLERGFAMMEGREADE